ncbi:hypothetical protein KLP28_16310 [Nocardioidaceae bacterium]|nr:hypothetical protein KLP28_16310 [Nocardioidaceae bacterium]
MRARVTSTALVALLAVVLAVLPSGAPATFAADQTSTGGGTTTATAAEQTSAARIVDVRPPGPRSGVVRALRRALRAADRGRPIPARTRPADADLARDVRTLPPRCTADRGESRHELCPRGAVDSPVSVAVLGNSHMAMWLAGLEPEAERLGMRIEPYVKYGCLPYRAQQYREGQPWTECSDWARWATDEIAAGAHDLVVVASHTWLKLLDDNGEPSRRSAAWDRQWQEGIRATVETLRASGARVVVLGDSTTRRSQPGRCAQRRDASMRRCEQRLTPHTLKLLSMTSSAATAGGAQYLNMNDFLCLRDRCPIVSRRLYVFRDKLGHIPSTYSFAVRRAFSRSLGLRAS